jgi:hypothetical protein
MSFALSVFDIFASVIPGSLYLAVFVYVSDRLGWVDLAAAQQLNTTVLLVGLAFASYLLGHITYPLGQLIDRKLPLWRHGIPDARREFLAYVPAPKAKLLVQVDPFLLLTGGEVRAREAAVEVSRVRSNGIMLRNAFPPLFLASAVSLVEFLAGANRVFAACCAIIFLLAAIAALRHGRTLAGWAIAKTLQVAFWTTGWDDLKDAGASADDRINAREAQSTQPTMPNPQPPDP